MSRTPRARPGSAACEKAIEAGRDLRSSAYHQLSMCTQCMIGAMSAGATATGLRAWLIARAPTWLTPTRQRLLTRTLLVLGVLAAGVIGPSAA